MQKSRAATVSLDARVFYKLRLCLSGLHISLWAALWFPTTDSQLHLFSTTTAAAAMCAVHIHGIMYNASLGSVG